MRIGREDDVRDSRRHGNVQPIQGRRMDCERGLAYSLPRGSGLKLEPSVGASYVEARRGKATESGTVVALSVDHRGFEQITRCGTGADWTVRPRGAALTPYLSVSVRHAFETTHLQASPGFIGINGAELAAFGAGCGRTAATGGAGAGVDVAPGVRLFGSYIGDYASRSTRHGVAGGGRGISLRF